MSLHPQLPGEIPLDTVRVAVAAFPKGNIYLRMREELGVFYDDQSFAPLFAQRGQPALAPWRLALITIMQFKVHLSETCDADAPHLITHVETTPTTTKDHQVTEPVHQALESQELLPQEHLVDGGYVDAELYHFPK